jgi:hypothetical protein
MTAGSLILLAALLVAGAAFLAERLSSRFSRVQTPVAPPRGSAAAGVLYAFTLAFGPSAKESASLHLPSYLAGIAYHLGIFAAIARLLATLVPVTVPPAVDVTAVVLFALGLGCGLTLLGKRVFDPRLRAISVPDDFLANLLVDTTLVTGIVASLDHSLVALFQITGAALLVYAPLGKLRHILFLLASRRWLGATLGRRGVRPSPPPGASRG